MSTFERRTPQYLRIYRDLKRSIEDGSFEPGERLPTQRELARRFGVTVMTLRQALLLLEQEQLTISRQGSGTFVAPRRVSFEMGNLRSLAQEMVSHGLELTTRVLRAEYTEPHPRVAELLGTASDEPVWLLERLRYVEGDPVVLQRSHVLPWLGEALIDHDLANASLYDVLIKVVGIEISRAHETIQAVALTGTEATLLDEEPGAPALLSERLTFSGADNPIIFDRALMAGDRLSLSADRLFSDITVDYRFRLEAEDPAHPEPDLPSAPSETTPPASSTRRGNG